MDLAMVLLQQWFTLMIAQWLVLWPLVFLGVGLSTMALMLTPRPWWDKLLPKNPWGQLLGGLALGLLFPLGAGGTLPLLRRLLWQTGSTAGAIAFWLSAISINPFVLIKLWHQLPGRGGLVLFYGSLSLIIVFVVSGIFTVARQQRSYPQGDLLSFSYPAIARPSSYRLAPTQPESSVTTNKLTILPTMRRFRSLVAVQNFSQELIEWSTWLLIACGVLAIAQVLFPLETLLEQGVIGLMGAGILYVLQPGQAGALADLLLGSYGSGVALGLLLTGTFFNGVTLIFLINIIRWRAYTYLVLLLGLIVLAFDLWLNFYVF
jgi:uncharacterized protein